MKCPICNCMEDKVLETRLIGEGAAQEEEENA